MRFSPPTPILRIFDEELAIGFYIDFLGFTVDWEFRFEPDTPIYMQVTIGEVHLHLSEHFGDAAPGSHVRIEVCDVDEFNRVLLAKGYKYARPGVQLMPWKTRDMKIDDPFGNRLTFFTPS